jgi:hypothetical protein
MTSEDFSLGGRQPTIQRSERIRRCVLLVMEYGSMIGVIAVLLAVLIVIWVGGREARVAWARASGVTAFALSCRSGSGGNSSGSFATLATIRLGQTLAPFLLSNRHGRPRGIHSADKWILAQHLLKC